MTTPAPDPTTFSIDDWISGATRPEDVVTLSSKGHEYGQYKALELELLRSQKVTDDNPDDRLVSTSSHEPVRIATEMADLAKVIDSGRHPFRLRGIGGPDLKAMQAETEDMDDDEKSAHMLALCCIDPVLTPTQWNNLRVAIGEGQYTQVIRAANRVSFGEAVGAPFSVAASVALRIDKS